MGSETHLSDGQGPYGEYLKYNNPHKTSLYLTAGIPVIVWKEAAIADFILKNKLGIAVEKLEDIRKEISNVTEEEYQKMIQNVIKVSDDLRKGEYLKRAIRNLN